MPSLTTYAVLLVTGMALLVVPGPAVLYVVTRSIEMGRGGGLASVAGITTGTIAYVSRAGAGLSSLLLASTPAFDAVGYAGAAYPFLLGARRRESAYALAAGAVADRLRGSSRLARVQRWFGGSVLGGLGILAAVWTPSRSR